ncbi:hypothetical protein SY83_02915 [Paenibacillus swuensis]|uniref:Uncharacterized protein n=1 Tax=Paenibacillus swuensis TaxID=1178515 RepID=A0A172TEY7_9BACL|nr:spore germination protein GerPC [Paenibacillus swuensis]ANE45447.1 hypothetical protein SY83_02915 [Paenibacillus swuensis]
MNPFYPKFYSYPQANYHPYYNTYPTSHPNNSTQSNTQPYSNPQNNPYLVMLEQRIRQLEAKQQFLEQEQAVLKEQLQSIKPIHIENINYKIQELTVSELSGTLNIGMTALTDHEQLQKWLSESSESGEPVNIQGLDSSQSAEEDPN